MSYAPDTATTTLITTGMLPALMLTSAALTAPVSLLLVWLYRRAVLRSMAAQAGGVVAPGSPESVATNDDRPLQIRTVDAAAIDAAQPPVYQHALRSLLLGTSVYVVAGLAYALLLTSAWLVFTRDEGFVLSRFLWLMSCYAWPTALAVGMLAAVSRGQRLLVAVAYFAMLFAVAIYGLMRNAEISPAQLIYFWMFTNAPATLLLLAFLQRRVRAVGPLVLSFMVIAVIGSQVLLGLVGSSESAMRGAVTVGGMFGLDGNATFYAIMLLGFALFGVAGWWLIKWLGRRYQDRKMSDQSLTLDAMWLLFGVVQSITLAFEGWAWVFTGLAAFAVYKALTALGFAVTGVNRGVEPSPTLLLLRVFALGSRSERLFDGLSKRWLRVGSISMIAGPDLVTSTVEPHEFLDFVGGDLSRQFVRGGDDLERRLREMAHGPDPDGRYRVNEFFCYADTWKETMRKLSAGADAVLMDLRSFSPSNQGCVFELQQLLDAVSLDRIVFLLDDTTDRAFLEQTLQDAWRRVRSDSPNRRSSRLPEARLLRVAARGATDVRGLLKLLFAGPAPQLQPA
ncbi:MAG: hypothetical protein ACXWI6_26280 [Burkholderiales bacterium]